MNKRKYFPKLTNISFTYLFTAIIYLMLLLKPFIELDLKISVDYWYFLIFNFVWFIATKLTWPDPKKLILIQRDIVLFNKLRKISQFNKLSIGVLLINVISIVSGIMNYYYF